MGFVLSYFGLWVLSEQNPNPNKYPNKTKKNQNSKKNTHRYILHE